MTLFTIIFFICVAAVFHTYVLYPWYLDRRQVKFDLPLLADSFPCVDIVIAAYNEEQVILQKLHSICSSDYPLSRLRLLVGSDGSDDKTEELVQAFKHEGLTIELFRYERSGKTATINKLMTQVTAPICILTDANVLFTPTAVSAMVSYFDDDKVGLVGADIQADRVSQEGISIQENGYLQRENRMKWKEGALWGTMMGAFGGCYAIRSALFVPVPAHFLVDDFHITMKVIDQGYNAILAKESICIEDISTKLSEEFRRKVRMSTGNFQNLRVFFPFMFRKRSGLAFSFISHKVLRWFTPVFILVSLFCAFMLKGTALFWQVVFYSELTVLCIPLMELTLDALGIHSRFIRYINYFVSMNAALFIGMVKASRKVERAIWKPTERNL